MDKISLPTKFESKSEKKNEATLTIEPCYPGYGTTLANSLRRILLSSLPGDAIYAVKIKGATHEFSTIPGVKEDVVEIILNLKSLRFKLHNTEETKVLLKVKGEKEVKAKDIKATSEVEVINPNLHIATMTDKDAEFEMELLIKSGRGYLPVENIDSKKFDVGTIAVDAIFTPIKNVNFRIENVRVGQITNYDRLILGITTDGSITPEDALNIASGILVEHFQELNNNFGKQEKKSEKKKTEATEKKKKIKSKKE